MATARTVALAEAKYNEEKDILLGAHLKTLPIKGVPDMDSMPGFPMQLNFPSIHFYKIKNGKIYDIETIGVSVPFGTIFGW